MSVPRINYIAIVTCVVFQFIFGMFWYSPWLFGDLWFTWTNMTIEDFDTIGIRPHVLSIIATFVATYALAWLIVTTRSNSAKGGAKIGFIVWAGFLAPVVWASNAFKGYSHELSMLESGFDLICFIVAGIVLGSWRRRN